MNEERIGLEVSREQLRRTLRATEFGWPERRHDEWGAESDAIQSLMADFAQAGAVSCLVLVDRQGAPWPRLLRRRPRWPSVIPGQFCPELGAHALKQFANPGFSLLLGMTSDPGGICDQLVRHGFMKTGSSGVGSGEEFDPLFVVWNKEALARGFAVAQLLAWKGLVTFGHDCLPIYVMERTDESGE